MPSESRLVTDLAQLELWSPDGDPRRYETWSYDSSHAHGDASGWLDFLERRESASDRGAESLARAEAARHAVEIALAAQESIRTGAPVSLGHSSGNAQTN